MTTCSTPPFAEVWSALFDPVILAAVMPGCEKLELVDGQYVGEIKVKVGPIQGKFTGKVDLNDKVEPESYTMVVDGRGAPGFVKATAGVKLAAEGDRTRVFYDTDAQIGGKIASVGQRLLEASSRAIVAQSLEGLHANIKLRAAVHREAAAKLSRRGARAHPGEHSARGARERGAEAATAIAATSQGDDARAPPPGNGARSPSRARPPELRARLVETAASPRPARSSRLPARPEPAAASPRPRASPRPVGKRHRGHRQGDEAGGKAVEAASKAAEAGEQGRRGHEQGRAGRGHVRRTPRARPPIAASSSRSRRSRSSSPRSPTRSRRKSRAACSPGRCWSASS